VGTKFDKIMKVRINGDDKRLFREASIHIYGDESLSRFIRDAGFAFIELKNGFVERELDKEYFPTGRRYLRFIKPYKKGKRRRHWEGQT